MRAAMVSKDKTAVDRNRRHREKEAKAGIIRVEVKVPSGRREDILLIAQNMRNGEMGKGCASAKLETFRVDGEDIKQWCITPFWKSTVQVHNKPQS